MHESTFFRQLPDPPFGMGETQLSIPPDLVILRPPRDHSTKDKDQNEPEYLLGSDFTSSPGPIGYPQVHSADFGLLPFLKRNGIDEPDIRSLISVVKPDPTS